MGSAGVSAHSTGRERRRERRRKRFSNITLVNKLSCSTANKVFHIHPHLLEDGSCDCHSEVDTHPVGLKEEVTMDHTNYQSQHGEKCSVDVDVPHLAGSWIKDSEIFSCPSH